MRRRTPVLGSWGSVGVRLLVAVSLVAGVVTVAAVPSGAGASVWSVSASPSPPGPPDGALAAVSCVGASRCVGVGGSLTGTFAELWNGTTWSLVTSPNPGGAHGAVLAGVSCVTATSCYAVGNTATATLIERWDGARWSIVPSANPPSRLEGALSGVSCVSSTNCFAVGDTASAVLSPNASVKTLVERWNGSRWSIITSPNPTGVSEAALSGVSCTSATACFAVGGSDSGPFVERWNGSRWSIVASPTVSGRVVRPSAVSVGFSPTLNGVACVSASNCYAVGASTTHALIEHWNGSAWSLVTLPNPKGMFGAVLNGVSCATSTRCTAVGAYATTSDDTTTKELVEEWNGSTWSIVPSPDLPDTSTVATVVVADGAFGGLTGVACSSAMNCAAVGNSARVDRWNGTTWSIAPLTAHTSQSALADVSCPTATDCFAVGSYTTASTFVSKTLIEHWDGSRWSVVASPNPTGRSTRSFGRCPVRARPIVSLSGTTRRRRRS